MCPEGVDVARRGHKMVPRWLKMRSRHAASSENVAFLASQEYVFHSSWSGELSDSRLLPGPGLQSPPGPG
eukprot:5788342-Karenia_brevis.AAC.1